MTNNTTTTTAKPAARRKAFIDAINANFSLASRVSITTTTRGDVITIRSSHRDAIDAIVDMAMAHEMSVATHDKHTRLTVVVPKVVAPRMRRINGFTRGSSTFKCKVCTRLTRHTGVQSMGNDICPQCYDLAGIENEIADGYRKAMDNDTRTQVMELTDDIRSKGGDLADWTDIMRKCGLTNDQPSQTIEVIEATPIETPAVVVPETFTLTLTRDELGLMAGAIAVASSTNPDTQTRMLDLMVKVMHAIPGVAR